MFGLDDHADSTTAQTVFNQVSNGLCHPLLHLWPTRYLFHHSSQFAEPRDPSIWNVGNMGDSAKWE